VWSWHRSRVLGYGTRDPPFGANRLAITEETRQTGNDLDERIAARTEELLRINALLGEEIARHDATVRALRESGERMSATIAAARRGQEEQGQTRRDVVFHEM
jgi:C4-dicarboxylate-specific signal transduction histidine kinase